VEGRWGAARFLARRYPLGAIGAAIMLLFVLAALFAELITVYDPLTTDSTLRLAAPSAAHWMGADNFGRDVYSRIAFGARVSLAVGIGATALGCLFGVALGLVSGYLGGWVDLLVQRLIDILQALAAAVLALVMAAALGPSLQNTIVAIAIPLIPYVARVDPCQYARAARAAIRRGGAAGDRHERPAHRAAPRAAQHAGPLIVLGTAQFGSAILIEASLSFLGLGIPSPIPPGGACCRSPRPNTCASRPGW